MPSDATKARVALWLRDAESDLAFLVDLLPPTVKLPPSLLRLPVLTKYAVQHRYPGQDLPVDRRDYLKAIELAQEAVAWAGHVVSA